MTEGAIRGTETVGAKVRAVLQEGNDHDVELRFTYRGKSEETARLASGEERAQVGVKLRAADGCNVVYAMWRMGDGRPDSDRIVVQVKHNADAHRSDDCGASGYVTVRPTKSASIRPMVRDEPRRLHVFIKEKTIFADVDGVRVFEGELPAQAFSFDGPAGIRTDNVRATVTLVTPPD